MKQTQFKKKIPFFLFCDRDSQGKRKYFKMMMMETAAKVLFEKKVAGIFLLGLMITVKWGYCLHFSEEKSKQMTLLKLIKCIYK